MNLQHSFTPWYRQFWPWFLIALPSTVIVACFITIWIALQNDVGLVNENYYQEGLDINDVLLQDEAAIKYKVDANILFSDNNQRVIIFVSSDSKPAKTLTLNLSAAFKPENDHKIILTAQNSNLFIGAVTKPVSGRYYLSLIPDGKEWRLTEEVTFPREDPIVIINSSVIPP